MSVPIPWHKAFTNTASLLREKRILLGISQAELAQCIGRSTTYISKFENGRSAGLGFYDFLAICTTLGEAPHEILRKAVMRCPSEGKNVGEWTCERWGKRKQ